MKKYTNMTQYHSLTPQKTHHCSYHVSSQLYSKRLSFLLSSLQALQTAKKQKQTALHSKYLHSTIKNRSRIKDIRQSLARRSQRLWNQALKSASQARSFNQLERAFVEANKAIWVRLRSERYWVMSVIFMISQSQLQQCFDLIKKRHQTIQDISKAIDLFKNIEPPCLQPFTLGSQAPNFKTQEIRSFVPAPDLLKSYQQTFTKTNQDQRIVNTTNYKLKANFGQPPPRKNIYNPNNVNTNLSMTDQPVILQNREEVLLQRLRNKQIEATIPNMQQTLFNNELSHLQEKAVTVEHTMPLSEWKKLRNKLNPYGK